MKWVTTSWTHCIWEFEGLSLTKLLIRSTEKYLKKECYEKKVKKRIDINSRKTKCFFVLSSFLQHCYSTVDTHRGSTYARILYIKQNRDLNMNGGEKLSL